MDVKRKVCCDREIARAGGRWGGDFCAKVVDARGEAGFGGRDSGFVKGRGGGAKAGIKASRRAGELVF